MFKLRNIFYLYKIFSAREQKLFIILLCVGLVGLAGLFGNAYRAVTYAMPAAGGKIVEGIIGQPTNLNPVMPPESDADQDLRALLHAGLYKVDADGKIIPHLAEALPEISEDLKTYTVRLRRDLKWQDGQPITPDDVLYTVRNVQSKGTGSYLRNSFRFVKAEVLDEQTVRFTLRDPSVNFTENLMIGLLPVHLEGQYDDMNPVGAGPYKIKKFRYKSNREIVSAELTANENYFPHEPYIQNIQVKFYESQTALDKAYRSGNVSGLGKQADTSDLKPYSGHQVIRARIPQYQAVFFNKEKNDILGSLKVRQALRLGTQEQEIIANVYQGNASPVGGPTVGEASVPSPEYNLEEAKSLLEQDGWVMSIDGFRYKGTRKLEIILSTNDAEVNSAAAGILQKQWRQLGLDLKIQTTPRAEIFEKILKPREYQAVILIENAGHDADPYFFWHSSQATDPGLNFAMLRNNEIDKVITEARNTADPIKRNELYSRFTDLINAESVGVFLVEPVYLYALNSNIKNVSINRLVIPHERFANVHEWYIKTKRVLK